MTLENGQQGKDKQHPEKLRRLIDDGKGSDKVDVVDPATVPLGTDSEAAGHRITSAETETAIKEEMKPVSREPTGPEQVSGTHYSESNTSKAIVTFTVALVIALIVLAVIYALWPMGQPRG